MDMKKTFRLLLFCLLVGWCAPTVRAQSFSSASNMVDSAMFAYRSGSILLYNNYKSNAAALARTDRFIRANRPALLAGSAHVELLSYIPSWQVGNTAAINTASLQASVVRAYLLTQYGIPHTSCTFAIDTTQGLSNQVQLQVVSGPIPRYANTQINYSDGGGKWSAAEAVRAYTNGVPYASYWMILAKRDIYFGDNGSTLYALRDEEWDDEQWDRLADTASVAVLAKAAGINLYIKTAQGAYVLASAEDLNSGVNILYSKTPEGIFAFASTADILAAAKSNGLSTGGENGFPSSVYTQSLASGPGFVRTEPYAGGAAGVGSSGYRDYPIFGIKTNGLYWLAALPNIEMEFFFAKAMSIVVEGQYTWLSSYLPVENAYYIWGASLEVRHYLRRDKRFDGWYVGAYAHTGQYDFKFSDVGNQGDYYGGGLTGGYVLPIGKHFNLEFGLGVGYVYYVDAAYQWNAAKQRHEWLNPVKPSEDKWGVFPTKAKVSFVWKF